ncbi:cell wall glucanase [Cordyceps fumosorosea ARSEF 2679]|uniref:Crh-like protein n=1 Tax=Cordyceps fumosorosea (strain ARSEF 2679) TaxID=1081104 RepID=A0A167WI05_CORFA|nr:cell wall glucanase [Cordyceps fumosorosea ARSEF 2679]OAA63816.1 cell wall glucanase [Cordyceps fumosorosea ARSEF 2679]
MFARFSTAAVLALASTVVAQTSTECNPLKEDCPADPAFGKNGMNCDFTKGECDGFQSIGTKITYDGNGASFPMSAKGDAPTLRSDNYIFFGHVEIQLQAAEGKGIITSLVLLSDDLDEIDFETVGADNKQIQSNYFSKGDTTTYDRGGFHAVDSPLTKTHTYAFDWTAEKVEWFIDGKSVRTLKASDVGEKFPQSPMQVKVGAWVAGYDGNAKGTIEWAGGVADFSNGPAVAIYKSVKVTDYAGGSSATDKNVKEYVYGDKTGSAKSIQVKLSDGSSGSSSSASKSGSTTATSSASSSSASASASSSSSAATTMTSATSSAANSTSHSSTSHSGATATGSSTPTAVPNAAPKAGLALGAIAFGALAALAL